MASLLERIVSHGPKTKLLTPEQAARSVVVTHIGSQAADQDIVIYFQRRRNGGGDIDHVHIPQEGTAVVTFENSEVVEKVLQRSHMLEGSKLKVERFTPKESPEVYSHVEARVNFGKFDPLSEDTQSIPEILKTNTGVKSHLITSVCLTLSGTFIQVEAAHKILHCLVKRKGNAAEAQPDASNELNVLGSDSSNISDPNSLEVQPQLMQLLKRVYKKKLQDIEETFSVEIDWVENTTQVCLRGSKVPDSQVRLQEGCEAFIKLYQEFYPNMGREEVELPDRIDESLIHDVVSHAEANSPVIIEKADKNLVVYAEKSGIRRYVQPLKESLGLISDRISKKNRRGQGNKTQDASVHNKTSTQGRYFREQHLHQVLSNEVKLSLYQGDITDEAVDAIVNAANDRLQHGAGVAAAIVNKGGWQIQDESNLLIKHRGLLDVGSAAYTSGGSLSCRYVIHTVGPEWYKHGKENSRSLLRRACLESLHLAVRLNLSSIALTAISSGIFGVPKDICAEVLFNAIEEFSLSKEAKLSTLRDLRIVIIDEPTLSVFREEFVKRYLTQKTLPTTKFIEGRSSDKQETTPPTPISKLNAELSENKDSSLASGQTLVGDKTFSRGQRQQNRDVGSPVVPSNPEEIGRRSYSTTPESIKEVSLSNQDNENVKKDSFPTGELEEDEDSRNPNFSDPARVVKPVNSDESTSRSAFFGAGRGRGNFAPRFQALLEKNITAIPTRGDHLEKNVFPGTAAEGTSPPGLTVTQEGITLAKGFSNHLTDDEKGSDESVKRKDAVENNELGREDLRNVNQVQNSANQNVAYENCRNESVDGSEADENIKNKSRVNSNTFKEEGSNHLSVKDVENGKPGLDQVMDDLSKTGKRGEQESNPLAEPTAVNNNEKMSSQYQSTFETAKGESKSAMNCSLEKDISSTSSPHPSSDHRVSPEGVPQVRKDENGEHKDTGDSGSQNHVTGSSPICEGQTGSTSGRRCLMCMNLKNDSVFPWRCGHNHDYCRSCNDLLENAGFCPQCKKEGLPQGNQPLGSMTWMTMTDRSLPGYEDCGIIATHFHFSEGIQGREHPSPGHTYNALRTTAFLPLNSEGKEVCSLLRQAFDTGLLFTIGKSPTTGEENKIIWNGIELKTSQSGGPASYGYPDPSYIDRVKKQLADKGITQSHE